MGKDVKQFKGQLNADRLRNELLKRFGCRSEKEFIKKVLGTDDMNEAKKIIKRKLKNMDSDNPLINAAKAGLDGRAPRQLSKGQLSSLLTPNQKRKLKRYLEKNK